MRAVVFLASLSLSAASQTPTVQVFTFGGTDQDTLAGLVIDRQGNYVIAGTTASLDLPVNGVQPKPGGAYLYRFRGSRVDPIYPPGAAAVSAIAADPSHPGYLYAALSHALWKSTDSGDTWRRLQADWPAADCSTIAVAPKDGATVYALCPRAGYPNFEPEYLFRSIDAGLTWTRTQVEPQGLLTLTVDPFDSSSLWSLALIGDWWQFSHLDSFHSTDGGVTWNRTDPTLTRFAFDEFRAGVIFAAGNAAYYRSDDAGKTWTPLPAPPLPSLPAPLPSPYGFSVSSIAVLPSGDVVFLSGNVLSRTRDNGATWQAQRTPDAGAPCQTSYGPPDSALRVDPRSGSLYVRLCGSPQASIYRTDDAGATWTRVNATGLPQTNGDAVSPNPKGPSDYFAIVRKSFDAFVAKLSPSGDVIWSTFLGGVNDDYATGLALDSDDNVYVSGYTLSENFPAAGGFPAPRTGASAAASFVAKFSADGTRLLYSSQYAYDSIPRAIAVDRAGAAYVTGNAGPLLPTTPGVYQAAPEGKGPGPFVLKLDPSGSRIVYATFLGPGSYPPPPGMFVAPLGDLAVSANAIAVDADGNAYVGGTWIWKVKPDGSDLVYSTKLDGATINAVAIDADRNLYVGGAADTRYFYSSPGAFQSQVLPTVCAFAGRCWANPAFVAKINTDASSVLYSTYLGGDGGESTRSIGLDPGGHAYAAGYTISRSFPTRAPLQTSLLPIFARSGFATALTSDGTDAVFSTYLSDGRELETAAVALDPSGNPVVAGHNIGDSRYGGNHRPGPYSDVLIFRLDYSHTADLSPRLDAALDAASRIGLPINHRQRVSLQGSGFTAQSRVWFDDQPVAPISVTGTEVVVEPPDFLPGQERTRVSVESPDGRRSNEVLVAAGPATLSLYSADGSGTGQALALNEDGSFNSPTNPARRGTTVTVPANGLDPSATLGGFGFAGLINPSVSSGSFPGLPGEVTLIRVTVDPNLWPSSQQIFLMGFTFPGHQPVTLATDPTQ